MFDENMIAVAAATLQGKYASAFANATGCSWDEDVGSTRDYHRLRRDLSVDDTDGSTSNNTNYTILCSSSSSISSNSTESGKQIESGKPNDSKNKKKTNANRKKTLEKQNAIWGWLKGRHGSINNAKFVY